MNTFEFIQDLAVIMLIAGIITVVCHFFKQPVVLGYILAGIIIGPYTPPFSLIHNQEIINTLAELGIIFLMCSLGLDFDMRKLKRVGQVAFFSVTIEIILMLAIGYMVGKLFHWSTTNSLFLGAMISISSTTIVIKAVDDLGIKKQHFVQIIFGMLIVEDIFAILILALLSSAGLVGNLNIHHIFNAIFKLIIFLVLSLFLGTLLIPRIISSLAKFGSEELLLISVLGCCFGFCLLVVKLGYSVALGAFMMGTIIAESREHAVIERLVQPLKHMFSAIFFVSVGLLFNPQSILQYGFLIAMITMVVIVGKCFTGTLGTYLSGKDLKTSLKVAAGLTQIGEFSLIIIALGLSLNLVDPFLYPIAVAVTCVTTIITPILLKHSEGLSTFLVRKIPPVGLRKISAYTFWVKKLSYRLKIKYRNMYQSNILQVLIYLSNLF